MLGILLIKKPHGLTSHDVVNDIRRKFSTRRVGHAGTLDPLATGLLVIAVGPATRFLQYLPLEPKEYVAEIQFGAATSTYDLEGEITSSAPAPEDLEGAIAEALPKFQGLIQQLPPMFSAVKVGGKPLYKYARQAQQIRREHRTVHISTFEIESINDKTCRARIVCSGGTYVRSLAHDLGQAVGCGAFLQSLSRTQVGRFGLSQGIELSEADPTHLLSLKDALPPMPIVQLDAQQTQSVREGRMIELDPMPDNYLVALLEPNGNVFSVARVVENMLQPECVIPSEVSLGVS